jgi:hypothetical protein
MWYACGKRYYVCVTCMLTSMLWCSNTESVPRARLLVSTYIIVFWYILAITHWQYVLVCTGLYYYTFPVPVCTRYVLVRTASEPVCTKNPIMIPVMRFTIPDAGPIGAARATADSD